MRDTIWSAFSIVFVITTVKCQEFSENPSKTVEIDEIDFSGFDDSITHALNFDKKPLNGTDDQELFLLTNHKKERIQCILPIEANPRNGTYEGPTPLTLLQQVKSRQPCTILAASYWVYEVCHLKYVRQYHLENGRILGDEIDLGRYTDQDIESKAEELEQNRAEGKHFDTVKIDGVKVPYVEFKMNNGTVCDLTGQPRTASVRYICYPHDYLDVFEIIETSTCDYQLIVLTSKLCQHPSFNPKTTADKDIHCIKL